MPEQISAPQPDHVDLEIRDYIDELQDIDSRTAVSLVRDTYAKLETDRRPQEQKWLRAVDLYEGVVTKRLWEGTKVERASLAVPIVLDQLESAYPLITEALFNYFPTFFDVTPKDNVHPSVAARVRDVISAILYDPIDESGVNAITHIKMAIKQALLLGDGALELSWDSSKSRFVVEFADVRDIYIDPQTPGPLIDWSPVLVHRKLLTVEYLQSLRGTPEMNIPPDPVLNWMAKSKGVSSGDVARQHHAAAHRDIWIPTYLRTDPKHQQVECLVYWTRDRLIWVLNQTWAALNTPNPFGFIPYVKAPYLVRPGEPWGKSLAEILEDDQRYAQGIRNARLDNLALMLKPPRKKVAGGPSNPTKDAWHPGMVEELAKVENADVYKVENVTADSYREEQLIYASAAKRTGINDFVQSGVPTPSNANRSATGVMQQAASVNKRLKTIVENIEDYMITPLLYKAYHLMARFAPDKFSITNPADGQVVEASRGDFAGDVKFVIHASSRMVARDRLAMFLGPVSQLLFNDAVMKQANLQGKTIDFNEWERFFQEATATAKAFQFFRPMSPQEQQAMTQPSPEDLIRLQTKMMDAQTRVQMGQLKAETERAKIAAELDAASNESAEKSARELLKLLASERTNGSDKRTEKGSGGFNT